LRDHAGQISTILLMKILKSAIMLLGLMLLIMLALSFTSLPYYAVHNLSLSEKVFDTEPDLIVVLGGDGMPSADALMRCYFVSIAAETYPNAEVLVAIPSDPDDSVSQLSMFLDELLLRGVSLDRTTSEQGGGNTHEQATAISEEYGEKRILLITAPEHVYRSVATFRHAGCLSTQGLATYEQSLSESDLLVSNSDYLDVSNVQMRYNLWSYLIYEIRAAREYAAITYYWLRGWI